MVDGCGCYYNPIAVYLLVMSGSCSCPQLLSCHPLPYIHNDSKIPLALGIKLLASVTLSVQVHLPQMMKNKQKNTTVLNPKRSEGTSGWEGAVGVQGRRNQEGIGLGSCREASSRSFGKTISVTPSVCPSLCSDLRV